MNIVFRVNVKDVGYGHLKRCLSIAQQFINEGNEVFFFVDDTIEELFPTKGVYFVFIENERQFLLKLPNMNSVLLIVDGYFADDIYIQTIRRTVPTLYIVLLDTLKRGLMGADLLVNPGLYAEEFYKNEKTQKQYLLGSKYSILGQEYKDPGSYKVRQTQVILVTMGGMDPQNITSKILPALLQRNPFIKFYAIIGKYFQNKDMLRDLEKVHANLYLLENVDSLVEYIRQSDICIASAGTTVFELARCGIPTILFVQDENQMYSSRFWEKTKGVLNMGYYKNHLFDYYIKQFDYIIHRTELRRNMSKALVKNSMYGTENLVKEIKRKYELWKMVKISENR